MFTFENFKSVYFHWKDDSTMLVMMTQMRMLVVSGDVGVFCGVIAFGILPPCVYRGLLLLLPVNVIAHRLF